MASTAPSAADMTHALKGIDFPAKKKDLKKHAQNNNAPDEVISAIDNLPEEEFETMADVARAYGQEDRSKISGEEHGDTTEMARKGGSRSQESRGQEEEAGSRKGSGGSRSSR